MYIAASCQRALRWIQLAVFSFPSSHAALLSSLRFLRRRSDVRSANAALRHARQLLPRQHDAAQRQPGRPHHPLAHRLTQRTDWTPPTPPMGRRRQRPVIFLFLNPAHGKHFTLISCCHGPRCPAGERRKHINNNTTTATWEGLCVFFPLISLADQDFPEHAKLLHTLPKITCVFHLLLIYPPLPHTQSLGQKRGLFSVFFLSMIFLFLQAFVLCSHTNAHTVDHRRPCLGQTDDAMTFAQTKFFPKVKFKFTAI